MEASFKFKLPEEEKEFKLYSQAGDMHSALWDFSEYLRGKIKYSYDTYTDAEMAIFKDVQKFYSETLQSHDIDLN